MPGHGRVADVIARVPRDQGEHSEDFTAGKLLFASGHGHHCSLYFSNDRRIRLCHGKGPVIGAAKVGLRRYSVTGPGLERARELAGRHRGNADIVRALRKEGLLIGAASAERGGRLLELWGERGRHCSRGGPVVVPTLTQYQLNLIYEAARTGCNRILEACYEFAMGNPIP